MTIGTIVDRFKWQPYWFLLITWPWLVGAAVFVQHWHSFHVAASRQKTVLGVVTAVERGNRCQYTFRIGQEVYRASEVPLYDRHVSTSGEQVTVYYDPMNPRVNAITDFRQKSLDALGAVPLLLLGSGGVMFFGVRQWYLNSRRPQRVMDTGKVPSEVFRPEKI